MVAPTAGVAIVPKFDEIDRAVVFARPYALHHFVLMGIDLDECFWMIDAETKKALFVNQCLRDHHRPLLPISP